MSSTSVYYTATHHHTLGLSLASRYPLVLFAVGDLWYDVPTGLSLIYTENTQLVSNKLVTKNDRSVILKTNQYY